MTSRPKYPKTFPSEVGLLDLPTEVLQVIFKKCSQYDVQHNLALVCKNFLDISRLPGMVKIAKIDLRVENESECLMKIDKVLKFHSCKLELQVYLDGLFPLEKLTPYKLSVRTLKFEIESTDAFEELEANNVKFETLEHLEIDISEVDTDDEGDDIIQNTRPEFWDNFPNIRTLRINSHYEEGCPILQFIDTICLKCPKLEEFCYEGNSRPYDAFDFDGLKLDFKDHEKFLNLRKLCIEFDGFLTCLFICDTEEKPINENFELFIKYLSAKCPNLKKPIQSSYDDFVVKFWSD